METESKTEKPKSSRVYKTAGWKISRDGSLVHAENLRMTYDATIGEIYEPKGADANRADAGPKKLVDVTFAGGQWYAVTSATTKNERDRTMLLETFFSRYIPGKKKPSQKPEPKPAPAKADPLAALAESVAQVSQHVKKLSIEGDSHRSHLEMKLNAIESKLDRLMAELGVKVA